MAEKATVAINGFGRVGRALFRNYAHRLRASAAMPYEIVLINDRAAPEMLRHLLRYDSLYGQCDDHVMQLLEQNVTLTQSASLETAQWEGIDLLIESTGAYRTRDGLEQHRQQGARHALLSAPAFDALDSMVVYGVSHQQLTVQDRLVSAASCTTNAAAITLNGLLQCCDIERVSITEIHGYTSGQQLLDNAHQDPRRARSATHNMIPTPTIGLDVLNQVLPQLAGRLSGYSMRVPVAIGAYLDLTIELAGEGYSAAKINQHMAAHTSELLGYSDLPLVSSDFVGRSESAVFDATQTQIQGSTLKAAVWFDNEWGYSNRVLDLAQYWIETIIKPL